MTELVVNIQQLTRRYGDVTALDRVNFQAPSGQIYGLVGANGAGKTTLINHILGLLRARNGSVEIFGQDPVKHPVEVLKRIGYLSEDRDIPNWMSVQELMRYTQAYHRDRWDEAYASELLNTFTLNPTSKIGELSRGMRAQVALIAAVAYKPDLLVLDEPSSGLDAIVRQDILNAIVRTISEEGRTVIFSSHLLDEVERLSDHVTFLDQGRVVLEGSLESINANHRVSNIQFSDPIDSSPTIEGAITVSGDGRSWKVVHEISLEQVNNAIKPMGGNVAESRHASLEEIFVARVGSITRKEAA